MTEKAFKPLRTLKHHLSSAMTTLDDILYPENFLCILCGAMSFPDAVCGKCREDLRAEQLSEPHTGKNVLSLYDYRGKARSLVLLLKYKGLAECARILGAEMARECQAVLSADTIVTSVPMTARTLDQRGIDHGRLLAESFAEGRSLEYRPLLCRTHETAKQQGLNARQREKNLQGAFAAAEAVSSPVVLVDDVYTTGATASACIKVLEAAGARDVLVYTATKTPPPMPDSFPEE